VRVIVVGLTGNIGTALLRRLLSTDAVDEIVGVSRRPVDQGAGPSADPRVRWERADIARDRLEPLFEGADCLVHLGWLFQPSHRPTATWATNVIGTSRVFDSALRAGVGALVYASSVGAYSARDGDDPVDESWPTHAASASGYTVQKAYVERLLDTIEERSPSSRIVRFRPAFVFQRAAASQQRRLFAGPFLPGSLLAPGRLPVIPYPRGVTFQTIHADDVAAAVGTAVTRPVHGAFNLAADPVLDRDRVAEVLATRILDVPVPAMRAAIAAAWTSHLAPAEPLLFDAFTRLPTMSTQRARRELDWRPEVTAQDALRAFLEGVQDAATGPTPPLSAEAGGPARVREVLSGIGETDDPG
jgi:nucleoside-diphosphate-sugar epimerase